LATWAHCWLMFSWLSTKMREDVGLLLNEAGDQVTKAVESKEVLNNFIPFIFTGKTGLL